MKKNIRKIKIFISIVFIAITVVFAVKGALGVMADKNFTFIGEDTLYRTTTAEEEDYDEDSTVCEVLYATEDESAQMLVKYTYAQWEELTDEDIELKGYVYENSEGFKVAVPNENATQEEVVSAARDIRTNSNSTTFGISIAFALMAVSLIIMTVWEDKFTTYEKSWFLSIMILAGIVSLVAPEESCNGVNGLWIMILYLADIFLNILCELLISKQSKWNFIVSLFVEITEIAICIVLAYRFATMLTTLVFWIPCDIISFITWHKHPDRVEDELTEVRTLTGKQEILVISSIFIWTVVVGYFLSGLDLSTDLFGGNELLKTVVCYLDACVSAVAVANGVFILLRFREQWIAWFIDAILESVINILSGQFVLLVLKLGYITNSTYGYIKWTKYIKSRKQEAQLS